MSKHDGGPAFPQHIQFDPAIGECGRYVTGEEYGGGGMAKRDEFAKAAIPEAMRWAMSAYITNSDKPLWDSMYDETATIAYGIADAMLRERGRE